MYDDVLVPTDGSEGAEAAIEQAIRLAERCDAALHVITVVDAGDANDLDDHAFMDDLEAEARRAVDMAVERARDADVGTVEASVLRGDPVTAILDYIDGFDVDVVVMGTHGRTGLHRYVIGSVTEKVVRLADVPVLAVPLGEGDDTAEHDVP